MYTLEKHKQDEHLANLTQINVLVQLNLRGGCITDKVN